MSIDLESVPNGDRTLTHQVRSCSSPDLRRPQGPPQLVVRERQLFDGDGFLRLNRAAGEKSSIKRDYLQSGHPPLEFLKENIDGRFAYCHLLAFPQYKV